jgi:hypothetical protein
MEHLTQSGWFRLDQFNEELYVMKPKFVVIAALLVFTTCALGQNTLPEPAPDVALFQQAVPGPGPDNGPPPPNVFFRTEKFGDHGFRTGYFAIADSGRVVNNAPYSANAVSEVTQTLADGNRIVNKTSSFLARDSQGRTRREETLGSIGPLSVNGPKIAYINDPVSKANYVLDLGTRTAEVLKNVKSISAAGPGLPGGPGVPPPPGPVVLPKKLIGIHGGPEEGEQRVMVLNSANEAGQTKTESLGTQTIEGVTVEGKRSTRTIPAGQIGNERPIEITSEVWTSPELQLTVLSKRNDPRFGETVYRLTDIKRSEPDHSLFEVPADFTVKEPGK